MANATDFIAHVYDTIAKIFNFNNAPANLFMQMAWPGIPISAADFKDNSGAYDANLAEEVFSTLANITPAFSSSKFEDSGIRVDDLYEIIIASARPNGVPSDNLPTNPLFKLFADAQYEFVRDLKGSNSNPNEFYHPCKATPSNWYNESAAAFWARVLIQSNEIKPVTNASIFVKHNGLKLLEKGIWRVKPTPVATHTPLGPFGVGGTTSSDLKSQLLQKNESSKTALTQRYAIMATPPNENILSKNASSVINKMNVSPGAAPTTVLSNSFKSNFAVYNATNLTKRLVPISAYDKNKAALTIIDNQKIDADKLLVKPKKMPYKYSLFLNNLLIKDLPMKPASPATNGFSISFSYCRVNIDRSWLNLALLSTKNWYVYGTPAGEYSTGSADNNPGLFPLMPVSFILINNLRITANWSAEDRKTISQAVSFGPFDLRNGTFNQNTLEVKGMQIISCISRVMPILAPSSAL